MVIEVKIEGYLTMVTVVFISVLHTVSNYIKVTEVKTEGNLATVTDYYYSVRFLLFSI